MSKGPHITQAQVSRVSELLAAGVARKDIAQQLHLSERSVSRIALGDVKGRPTTPKGEAS